MPPYLWKVLTDTTGGRTVTIIRAPEDKHWNRFRYYALKVRAFGVHDHKRSLSIDRDAMMTLASYRPALTLLPLLREITFSMSSSSDKMSLMFAQCLLNSTIQDVSLVIKAKQYAIHNLIPAIRHICPDIKILKIQLFSPPPRTLVRALTDLVRALPRLQRLSIPSYPFQFDTLLHISTLLSLRILETGNLPSGGVQQLQLLSSSSCFPCLRNLTFSADSLEAAALVVDTIRQPLTSLAIAMKKNSPSIQLNNFIRALTQHPCCNSLLHLRISTELSQDDPDELDDIPDIHLLFLLPTIRRLAILSRPFAAAVDDAWLATAAAAWPRLRSLHIHGKTKTTLAGLVPLVRSCPLDYISIDANWAPFDIRRLDPIVGNTQIETITMFNSHLKGDVLAVLRCLLTMFPRLNSVRNLAWGDGATWADLQKSLDRSLQC